MPSPRKIRRCAGVAVGHVELVSGSPERVFVLEEGGWATKIEASIHIHHHDEEHLLAELRKVVNMAKQDVLDAIAKAKTDFAAKLAEAQAKITEDFDELKRLLAEAGSTAEIQAAVADLNDTINTALGSVDPDPNFPPPPPPPPPVEPPA